MLVSGAVTATSDARLAPSRPPERATVSDRRRWDATSPRSDQVTRGCRRDTDEPSRSAFFRPARIVNECWAWERFTAIDRT